PEDHPAPPGPGDRGHHVARLHLELQLVRPGLRAHRRRSGRPDDAADAFRVRGGIPLRPLRLRRRARRRDGVDHRHDAFRVLAPPPAGGGMKLTRVLQYLALAGYLVFLGFPLVWLLSTSFKPAPELVKLHPTLIPDHPTLVNYRDAFTEQEL